MKRTLATFLRFVLLAALLAGQTGCVDLPNNISVTEVPIPESDGLMPQNLQFSPDYKTLYLNVNETKDLEATPSTTPPKSGPKCRRMSMDSSCIRTRNGRP